MMQADISKLETSWAELCARVVEKGEALVVTRHGQPWVRIEPVGLQAETICSRRARYFAEHEQSGISYPEEFALAPRAKDLPREVRLD